MYEYLKPIKIGKVRTLYECAGSPYLVMVASDNISGFDVVMKTKIPNKGKVLNQLSAWWFNRLATLMPNHMVSTDVSGYNSFLNGRAMIIRRLNIIPIECVARAYLSGSGTKQYNSSQEVCGVKLPAGLTEGSRLPEIIFTPTTKGGMTGHDEPLTFNQVQNQVGSELAAQLRRLTIKAFEEARKICEARGIILADTKFEFGFDAVSGELVLGDEALTPDSSRFWLVDQWKPGKIQPSLDKQPLRDWLELTSWNKKPPGLQLPIDVVCQTQERYYLAYSLITGGEFKE